MLRRVLWKGLFLCGLALAAPPAGAQDAFDLGGTAYLDYFYVLQNSVEAQEGRNGFTYRRLYLTTDYRISESFSARARLEARGSSVAVRGPNPFVKDLYLRWRGDSGHSLTFGVTSPPAFTVSEDVWGYRSLAQTTLDLFGIVDSRDMGVRAQGPLLPEGRLQYALMVGNNNGVLDEEDRSKRVYAQLQGFPSERLAFTLGGDYAAYEGQWDEDQRDDGVTLNAFAGLVTGLFQGGLEGFWNRTHFTDDTEADRVGLSLFGVLHLTEKIDVIGRFDRARIEDNEILLYRNFAVLGVAYIPHPQVRFIPNLHLEKVDLVDEADLLGRVTLEFVF